MSTDNNAEESLLYGEEPVSLVVPKNTTGKWRSYTFFMIFVVTVVVVGVFAVTSSDRYAAASTALLHQRLELVKQGKIKYAKLSSNEHAMLFDDFKTTYGKKYDTTTEEKERYATFVSNMEKIDARNEKEQQAGGTAIHGVTQFADISSGEFKKFYLGYVAPSDKIRNKALPAAKIKKYKGTATSVNWAGIYTPAINNQGYCGSCWAFSTIEQTESDSIRAGLLTTSDTLSVQQLIACDNSENAPDIVQNFGCQGGNTETAYMYIAYVGGLVSAADYPYTSFYGDANPDDCEFVPKEYKVTVSGFHKVVGESAMQDYVMSTGPLSVCLDATGWETYQGGIMSACGDAVNHCVQVVGIDTGNGYWIVRNSWGTSWGINGYIWLKSGQNTCSITTDPTYVTPAAVSR